MDCLARWMNGRSGKAALAAVLAILVGVAALAPFPGRQVGTALAAAVRDPMSMFAARSPGQRPAGALTRTKKRLAVPAPGAASLTERVLSSGRTRPVGVAPGVPPVVAVGQAIAPDAVVPFGVGPSDVAGGIGPALPAFGSAAAIGIASGGGGGGGFGTPGTPGPVVTTPVPEVTTPVPEPATWLSMIVGLAVIGFALRRRADRASRGAASSASGGARAHDAA